MSKKYSATREDLDAIGEALTYIWNPKMDFVFKDRSKISKTLVISYDSKFIYIWEPLFKNSPGKYKLHKIPHKLRIKNEWQMGWWAGLVDKSINKFLPASFEPNNQFTQPIISGGLLKPFVELQKNKKLKLNPYVTKESYLATIIHEFGHVYWDSFKMWWPSENSINLRNLRIANKLYSNFRLNIEKYSLTFPVFPVFGEVFAFCAEYYASELFWKNHKRNLDSFIENRLNALIILEKKKNLEKEDSVIEPSRYPHDFAFVFGKIILEKYPTSWFQILIDQKNISPQL